MDKPSVYFETSCVSYLAARPSRDVIVAAHQQITIDWWETRRQDFEVFISQVVVDEAKLGDPEAAARRLKILDGITCLQISEGVARFAERLVYYKIVPESELRDAIHISVSCVQGINYLLTWNCKHIANVEKYKQIEKICAEFGYVSPIIGTPEELLGG